MEGGTPPPACVGPPTEVGQAMRGNNTPSAECSGEKPVTMGTMHCVIDDITGKAMKSITIGG